MTLRERVRAWWPPAAVFAALALAHLVFSPVGEPFRNGDETRHVMTGVFIRDALADLPATAADPKGYATAYYLQYPALGIIVWPPFFYLVEGLAMWVFGTGYLVARLTQYAFALFGGVYAYRLFCHTHDRPTALAAVAVLGLAPLVFIHTAYVLLEVPTLALVVAAVFHFERYLSAERGRDALLACLFAGLAALTRFDAVLLLPFVLLRLGFARRWRLLLRKPVIAGVVLALVLTVPYYLFTWKVYGSGIKQAAVHGTAELSSGFLDPWNFVRYPSYAPALVGWTATVAAVIGLGWWLWNEGSKCGPYIALLVATYVTFVPLAEPEPRHAIYWVPALAVFAVRGVLAVVRQHRVWGAVGCGLLVAAVGAECLAPLADRGWKLEYILGTDEAAEKVLPQMTGERPVMYDGQLNGAFVYHVRRRDPYRKMTILRGDKVLYSVFSDPRGKYEEYAATDDKAAELLHRYDPAFVIVEEPQVYEPTVAGDRLRRMLRERTAEYELWDTIPLTTNFPRYVECKLLIYRKLKENPERLPVTSLPVMGLGGEVTK